MANEFVARKGIISSGSVTLITGSFVGPLEGTASFATTASFALNGGGSTIEIAGSAPASPSEGDLWYDNTTGKTYIYYVSESIEQWVLQSDPTYNPGPSIQDLQDVTDLSNITTNAIIITNETNATSKTTGALIVSGGLGVGKSIVATSFSGSIRYSDVVNVPSGIVSSSGQVSYTGLSNVPAGIVSSSGQIITLLPEGTVSSSTQASDWTVASSSFATTASFAVTASYAENAGGAAFPFTGSAEISGTLDVTDAVGIGIAAPTTRKIDVDGGEVRIGQSASGVGAWLAVNLTSGTTASAAARVSLRSSASDSEAIPSTQPNLVLSRGSDTLGTLLKFTNQRLGFAGIGSVASNDNLHDMRVYTGDGSERIRITDSGSVGIGTTDPAAKLHVQGNVSASSYTGSLQGTASFATSASFAQTASFALNASAGSGFPFEGDAVITGSLLITGSSNSTPLQVSTPTGSILFVTSSARVGINLDNPQYALHVSGAIFATDNVTAFSDKRVKDNVIPIENALLIVQNLDGVRYTRNDSDTDKQYVGFIAQDVLEVLPEVVEGSEEHGYGISYGNITALLVQAIKEQQKQIDELKSQLVDRLC
jgi:hypothetical protein